MITNNDIIRIHNKDKNNKDNKNKDNNRDNKNKDNNKDNKNKVFSVESKVRSGKIRKLQTLQVRGYRVGSAVGASTRNEKKKTNHSME